MKYAMQLWWFVCGKDSGGLVIDGRRLIVCRAVSRDTVQQHIASQQKTETTDSRNLHLVRESCMLCSVMSALLDVTKLCYVCNMTSFDTEMK